MFTTPNTINVPPEYEVETDVPSVAEFVTCSLNGRLWVFKRSRRYYVAVFRWDEDTQRLVFVSTTVLSNLNIIRRGIDWILTDSMIILSLNDEPYILQEEYSSDDDIAGSDIINYSSSFFPELETLEEKFLPTIQVIEENDVIEKLILGIELIPLEFHYYSDDDIRAFTDFIPKLVYCNGYLYGKGIRNIGRVFLLPRSFTKEWTCNSFYLYISPDYKRSYDSENQTVDSNDGWDKLIIAPINANSVAVFTPQENNSVFCKKTEDTEIYLLPQGEKFNFIHNNDVMFFDGLTQFTCIVNDEGISFLHNELFFEGKGLQQWLAPSGKIETIEASFVISPFDNNILVTYIKQNLYRELIKAKKFISLNIMNDKLLLISNTDKENNKKFIINSIKRTLPQKSVLHENVYRDFLTIDEVYSGEIPADSLIRTGVYQVFHLFPYLILYSFEGAKGYDCTFIEEDGKTWYVVDPEVKDARFLTFMTGSATERSGSALLLSKTYKVEYFNYITGEYVKDKLTYSSMWGGILESDVWFGSAIWPHHCRLPSYYTVGNIALRDNVLGFEYSKAYGDDTSQSHFQSKISFKTESDYENCSEDFFFKKTNLTIHTPYRTPTFVCGKKDSLIQTLSGENYHSEILFLYFQDNTHFKIWNIKLHPEIFDFKSEAERSKPHELDLPQ